MRRINWPFAGIALIAFLAALNKLVLQSVYEVPGIIRWHLSGFGAAAFFTFILSFGVNLLTRRKWRVKYPIGFEVAHFIFVFVAIAVSLGIELGELTGTGSDGGPDLGQWIIDQIGIPDSDTYDPRDIMAILAGGLVVGVLQIINIRRVRDWRWVILLLHEPAPKLQAVR